ncbi:PHP domain-containing protein [uncultured Dialister sp.]|uniref:PHP domain-containing protein n=1 Tax=uncultured Dialister sp. TaxID=278064 RepID=UPI00259145D0|nr:PHP domain-containing protein [uncultured Dialister sp.]
MYKVITHLHTKYSHDSLMPFALLYRKCLKKGINYIAVTEHNNAEGALQFKRYCERHGNRLKVIIGEEIMTTEGEIIGLYLDHTIKPLQSPEQTVASIREQGGIVYVPHPYDLKRYKTVLKESAIRCLADQIDCIECHNGRNISKDFDRKQTEIAEKYGITKVIGADAHTIFEVGYNYMETDRPLNSANDFKAALGEMKFHPRDCKKWCHQLTRVDRVVKMIQKGDLNGLCHVVLKKFKRRKS